MAAADREPAHRLKLLIDTNILLDVVLERKPWVEDATALLDAIAKGQAEGYVASHTIPTVYYVVARARNRAAAATATSDLLQLLTVVPLDNAALQRALALNLKDFEDAAQAAAALEVGADCLVTRNPTDYKGAAVIPRSAGEALALLPPAAGATS
jgi:predicted nucleic acid-binding protein